MSIQEFLTYFINTFVLSSIIFFLLDFYFYLLNSWQQLNPSTTKPDFYASCSSTESEGADTWGLPKCLNAPSKTALAYQQVKDIFRDAPALVIAT